MTPCHDCGSEDNNCLHGRTTELKEVWIEYKKSTPQIQHGFGCSSDMQDNPCNCGMDARNHRHLELEQRLRQLLDALP